MLELALGGRAGALPLLRPRGAARARVGARAAARARAARRRARRDDGADRRTSCTRAASATSTRPGPSTAAPATRRGRGSPTTRSSAPPPASLALAAHPPVPHAFDGLEFVEVASVTRIAGGIAMNVIPDRVECHVNFRYAPGRGPAEAEARLAELCAGHGELRIDANAPSGPVGRRPAASTRSSPPATWRARPSRPGRRWPSSARPASPPSTSARASPPRRTGATSRSRSPRSCARTRCWSGSRHEARPGAHRHGRPTRSCASPRRSGGCWPRAST